MPFQLLVVFVVDVLELVGDLFADVAFEVGADVEVQPEGVDVVEPFFAEFAERMVEGELPSLADVSYFLMLGESGVVV